MGRPAPHVQSLLGEISPMPSKQKTRLALTSTFPHFHSTRLLVDMEASKSIVALESLYLMPLLLEIMLFLLGIGLKELKE